MPTERIDFMTYYLEVDPTDSNADAILCRMLPDYKAEIRRNHHFTNRGTELNFSKLPIIAEAEAYLRGRVAERQSGKESATSSHHAIVKKNRSMLAALMAIKDYEVGPDPYTSDSFKSYLEVIHEIKAIASKAITESVAN
jgi:hypothetical protein